MKNRLRNWLIQMILHDPEVKRAIVKAVGEDIQKSPRRLNFIIDVDASSGRKAIADIVRSKDKKPAATTPFYYPREIK